MMHVNAMHYVDREYICRREVSDHWSVTFVHTVTCERKMPHAYVTLDLNWWRSSYCYAPVNLTPQGGRPRGFWQSKISLSEIPTLGKKPMSESLGSKEVFSTISNQIIRLCPGWGKKTPSEIPTQGKDFPSDAPLHIIQESQLYKLGNMGRGAF